VERGEGGIRSSAIGFDLMTWKWKERMGVEREVGWKGAGEWVEAL